MRLRLSFHQRGRGRRGGRAVRERGRMRKRGPSGGGTFRRKSPQQGQRPSVPRGVVTSARSQWPRASHCGLMHCPVKPGKYCIYSPSKAAKLRMIQARPLCGRDTKKTPSSPWRPRPLAEKTPEKPSAKMRRLALRKKMLRTGTRDGGDCGASGLWCQEERLQDMVVMLRKGRKAEYGEEQNEVRRFSLTIRKPSY